MAASLPTGSYVHPQRRLPHPPHSFATEVFRGSKLHSPSSFPIKTPNFKVEFPKKVNEGIQPRTGDSMLTRAFKLKVPKVIQKYPDNQGHQWLDLYNLLYSRRILFLTRHIDQGLCNTLVSSIFYLDTTSSSRIVIYIHSPGGDLAPTMAIYDTMQSLYSPVGTHCMGYAYDMAAFLLAGGDEDDRSAMPHSRIALQSPAGAARGQADDVQSESVKLLKIRNELYKELASNTGQPVEKIYEDLSWMKFFSAQEALEYGIIDRIVKKESVNADSGEKM